MPNPLLEPEILIKRLSHRPRHLINCMISINKPKPPNASLPHRVSSIGTLDCLPVEITSMIFSLLDIPSVTRLALASYQAHFLVHSHHQYRDLFQHAPEALIALSQTGCFSSAPFQPHFPLGQLYATLHSRRCYTCPEFGAYLFLPSRRRCCWVCLSDHPYYRMMRPADVEICCAVPGWALKDDKLLPRFRVLPEHYRRADYGEPEELARAGTGPYSLISARVAGQVGFGVNGRTTEGMWAAIRETTETPWMFDKAVYLYWNTPPDERPWVRDGIFKMGLFLDVVPEDPFFGLAAMPFPSVSKAGEVEDGLWCQGCELAFRQFKRESPDEHGYLDGRHFDNWCRVLGGLERRAYSKAGFLEHIKLCYGARQLVPELGIGREKVGYRWFKRLCGWW